MNQAEAFRTQAQACADMGSPMYAALLSRAADDLAAGGATRDVLAGHEDDPGPSALALRLAGSVHRLVLQGRAPELAEHYPSTGGIWEPDAGWAAFERVLRDRPDEVRAWLDSPPQTNEVGRACALYGGLLVLGEEHRLPVRLREIGSSGGLNLRADHYGYTDAGDRLFGDESSPLVLRRVWDGRPLRPWADLHIVERLGSDVEPVDVSTAEGRLTLTAYVWPDQTERHQRLRTAFAIAAEHSAEVRRQDAASFVGELELGEGTTTVLWHSVVWQYLPRTDQDRVESRIRELGSTATASAPFAHLFLEPVRRTAGAPHEFLVVLETWPGGSRRVIGTSAGHGVPTIWE